MGPEDIFGKKDNNNVSGTDNGTVSFDELESAFGKRTQYQHFYEQPEPSPGPMPQPSDDMPQTLVNPDGEDLRYVDEGPEPQVDREHARRTGEHIAKLIDTGIDFTLSKFVAHNNETYRADEKDLHDIAECWGEISQERGWNIGPEWSLVILYLMVYGPLVKQAITDRQITELKNEQKKLRERMDTYERTHPQQIENLNDGTAETHPSPFTHQPAAE